MKATVQILRCEGINSEEKSLGCYIIVNKELLDVITPLPSFDILNSSGAELGKIEIPCDGELKLVLRLMKGDALYMGSVSVYIQALPSKGYVWLPLYQNIDSDSVQNLGGNFSCPRILISIAKPHTPNENTNLSKLQIKKLEFLIKQLEERLSDANQLYELEKASKIQLALGYETLNTQYEEFTKKSQIRETSLIKLLEKKDTEIQTYLAKANNYENKYNTLVLEKNCLVDMINEIKNNPSSSVIKQLNQDISTLQTSLDNSRKNETVLMENLENIGKLWTDAIRAQGFGEDFSMHHDCDHVNEISLKVQIIELVENNKALKARVASLLNEREKLRTKLFEFEEIQCQQTTTILKPKEPDLSDVLCNLGFQDLFNKNSEGYHFNNEKINLSLENGKIVVNSIPVENFLQLSFTNIFDKSVLNDNEAHYQTFSHSPKSGKSLVTSDGELENINKTCVLKKNPLKGTTPDKKII
jgi:hypothetical protein